MQNKLKAHNLKTFRTDVFKANHVFLIFSHLKKQHSGLNNWSVWSIKPQQINQHVSTDCGSTSTLLTHFSPQPSLRSLHTGSLDSFYPWWAPATSSMVAPGWCCAHTDVMLSIPGECISSHKHYLNANEWCLPSWSGLAAPSVDKVICVCLYVCLKMSQFTPKLSFSDSTECFQESKWECEECLQNWDTIH